MSAPRPAGWLLVLALMGGGLARPSPARAVGPPAGALQRVLESIRKDEAYKVRLQAIRVLVRQLQAAKTAPDEAALRVLGEAVREDEEHLVRGLACFALGELGDPRGRGALEAGRTDRHPFVRAQAEEALKALASRAAPQLDRAPAAGGAGPEAGSEARSLVVIGVDASPGVRAGELDDALRGALGEELARQAHARYRVGEPSAGASGFKLSGAISERSAQATEDGATTLTIGVRITISTLPENHLRGMTNAKASAGVKVRGAALAKAEQTVLRAAVGRAVKDTLAQLAQQ